MTLRTRRLAALCLVLALALAAVAEYYFSKRRAYMGDAVFIYGVASVLFLAAVRLADLVPRQAEALRPAWWRPLVHWLRAYPIRALLASASVLAILAVGARAQSPLSASQGYGLLALWIAGLLLYLAAATDLWAARKALLGLPAYLRAKPWEPLVVLALFAVAAVTRLTALDRIPFLLGGDEASMGQEAVLVLQGRSTNPFVTGWFSHPTLFFYLLAIPVRWLGANMVGLRFVPALTGALTVPALYLLARELFDRRVAVIAAAYLACYHYAIHFSRLGLNNMMDPLLATLAFYFLLVGLRSRRFPFFALAGLSLGLDQYFYMGSRVIPIVLVVFLVWTALREPGFWRTYGSRLCIMAGALLLTGWPLFLFFAHHPNDFMARVSQLGIFQPGWLDRAAEYFQRSKSSILWEQVVKSALAFHYYPDPGVFYRPGMPLLDVISVIPFTFGLVYAMARLRERRHSLFVFWFWGVLVFGGMLLENPPSSQRIVLTVVPVSVFIALGIVLATNVAERAFRWQRSSTLMVVGLTVLALGTISLRFYFGTYTHTRSYADLNTEVGQEMGHYLSTFGSDSRFYFFGAPRMYAGFPTTAFLAPQIEGQDVLDPLVEPPTFVNPDKRPLFIFLPERAGELEQVKRLYPAGKLREFRQQPSGMLLFVAYEPDQ